MVSKVNGYQCDYCGTMYPSEKEAEFCEQMHVPTKELVITMAKHAGPDSLVTVHNETACGYFPVELFVEKKDFSGTAARYVLRESGSMEDVYPIEEEGYD